MGDDEKILQAIEQNLQQSIAQQSSNEVAQKRQKSNTSKSRKNKENHSPGCSCKTVNAESKEKANSPSHQEQHSQQVPHSNITYNSVVSPNTTPSAEFKRIETTNEDIGIIMKAMETMDKAAEDIDKVMEIAKAVKTRDKAIEVVKAMGDMQAAYAMEIMYTRGKTIEAEDKIIEGISNKRINNDLNNQSLESESNKLDNAKDYITSTSLHDTAYRTSALETELSELDTSSSTKDKRIPYEMPPQLAVRSKSMPNIYQATVTSLTDAHNNDKMDSWLRALKNIEDNLEDMSQNPQFKSQYAINLAASYVNKPTDTIDKSDNIIVSYKQEVSGLMNAYLAEAKFLQNEIVGNGEYNQLMVEDISFTSTSSSEVQIPDISSSTIDDTQAQEASPMKEETRCDIEGPFAELSISDTNNPIINDDQAVTDNKIVSNDKQLQKANSTRKSIYAIMVISPFIAVGIYSALTLSTAGIMFNPIIAAGIFASAVAFLDICLIAVKTYNRVNKEKNKDENINSCIISNNESVIECSENSKVVIL